MRRAQAPVRIGQTASIRDTQGKTTELAIESRDSKGVPGVGQVCVHLQLNLASRNLFAHDGKT